MDNVNIYGSLKSGSVIIGAGNFNTITSLLAYYPNENLLQLRSLPEIVTPAVLELVLNYEKPITAQPDKLYFSLQVKQPDLDQQTDPIQKQDPNTYQNETSPLPYQNETSPLPHQNTTSPLPHQNTSSPLLYRNKPKYINVQITVEGDQKVATACISNEKAIFSPDFSAIDRSQRGHLLAGSLYSLETILGEQTYVVSWKIHGFSNGDLVVFLPTTWYERNQNDICAAQSGVDGLVNRLNQVQFQGFTTQKWCEEVPTISHCPANTLCGPCLGQCLDASHICFPSQDPNSTLFRCGLPSDAPNMEENIPITDDTSSDTSAAPTTTGTTATWVAMIVIFIIVLLLAWGLATQLKIE